MADSTALDFVPVVNTAATVPTLGLIFFYQYRLSASTRPINLQLLPLPWLIPPSCQKHRPLGSLLFSSSICLRQIKLNSLSRQVSAKARQCQSQRTNSIAVAESHTH